MVHPFIPGSPAAASNAYFLADTNMKVGAYTLLKTTMPGDIARNVVVTHTAVDTADTLGTITIEGTDFNGNVISEVITPVSGTAVQGTKAFASVTKATGTGWVIDTVEGSADKVKIGYGNKLGLPVCLSRNTVLRAYLGGALQGTAPTVAFDAADLAKNTVLLSTALNGDEVIIEYTETQ